MTQGIKWLASYPKSGNTWARLFLLNWFADLDEPLNPNELERTRFCPACDTPWLWEDATGVKVQDLSKLASFKLRPHVQWFYGRTPGEIPPYLKTHSSNTTLGGVFPYINWDATDSAVYIIRDPRKVAASLADHMGFGLDLTVNKMNDRDYFAEREERIYYHIGPWSKHVESWQKHATVVRYEDLPDAFEAILETFGLPIDERMEKAKTFTQLQTLKWFENANGFREASRKEQTFFGGKRKELTGSQIKKIEQDHEKVMREYGYL